MIEILTHASSLLIVALSILCLARERSQSAKFATHIQRMELLAEGVAFHARREVMYEAAVDPGILALAAPN